jgi:hypothetical protein
VLPPPSICGLIYCAGSRHRATGYCNILCAQSLRTYLASEDGFAAPASLRPPEAPVESALG